MKSLRLLWLPFVVVCLLCGPQPEGVDFQDGTDTCCCSVSWATGNIAWTADLEGEYQTQPDGSLLVTFVATPKEGPAYTDLDCFPPETSVSPSWPGAGGILVDGLYDQRVDHPITQEGMTGQVYSVIHVELSQNG